MKIIKTNNKHCYKDPLALSEELDDISISLKDHPHLIDRVHERYPLLDKTQISIIIKHSLMSLRNLIIFGNIINFNKLFFDMKLLLFKQIKSGKLLPSLKVKISTPKRIKK